MGNVWRAFTRDVKRLFKAPAALVVVAVLVILPSLYTWFNVAGFWNPYQNTGNLRVCVVNEDNGASTDLTGDLDLGGQIVEQLESNDQLGWVFTDRTTAMEEVRSGKSYAAFIIPSDFSEDITTLLTGDFIAPKLQYYVNEKAGAVSPKITDTGANTLDETINSTFVSTVSSVVASTLDEGIAESKEKINISKSNVFQQLGKANDSLSEARSTIADFSAATGDATQKAKDAKASLGEVRSEINNLSDQMNNVSVLLNTVQGKMGPFLDTLNTSLDNASGFVVQASNGANTAVGNVQQSVENAQGSVNTAVEYIDWVSKQNEAITQQLKDFLNSSQGQSLSQEQKDTINSTISVLEAQNASLTQSSSGISNVYSNLDASSKAISTASSELTRATNEAVAYTDNYRSDFTNNTRPVINDGLIKLSVATSNLSAAISTQQSLVDQTSLVLDQLISALGTTSTALGQTDTLLLSFQDTVSTMQTDVEALSASTALSSVIGEDGVDPEKIADFMLSPTQLKTESLYSVNAYGSAMAPLFMNMSLWIGAFMLLVILRQEVDDEGISRFTTRQRYLAKWLFFAPLVALQAIVCCAGNLFLGVQAVNVPLFFLTAVLASLTYLSIQYALAITLQHIGKALCVILIFVQIPGATGLYPIEMTPEFFQGVYPLLPFTYGINALRETIAGFYDGQWAFYIAILLLFMAIFFIGAFLARPSFVNLNRMFSKQIKEADLFVGEDVPIPARRYRTRELFKRLSDQDRYQEHLAKRVRGYLDIYPRLRRGAFIVGIVVAVVVTLFMSLFGAEKVAILTFWLIWLVSFIIFITIVEFMRDRLEHESSLSFLPDEEIDQLFAERKGFQDVNQGKNYEGKGAEKINSPVGESGITYCGSDSSKSNHGMGDNHA